jgi:hypothetical protein
MTRKTAKRIIIDLDAFAVLTEGALGGSSNLGISNILGVSLTCVWRAREERNVTPELLRGLAQHGYLDPHEVHEVLKVAVTPCPECGEAHTVPWCTDKDGEPVKPVYNRKGPKRKHPPTLKIRTDDVDSAAASILRSYPAKLRPALLERLADAATEE